LIGLLIIGSLAKSSILNPGGNENEDACCSADRHSPDRTKEASGSAAARTGTPKTRCATTPATIAPQNERTVTAGQKQNKQAICNELNHLQQTKASPTMQPDETIGNQGPSLTPPPSNPPP
jgi:uncharacterized protein YkwD